jgi:hypothetical protein
VANLRQPALSESFDITPEELDFIDRVESLPSFNRVSRKELCTRLLKLLRTMQPIPEDERPSSVIERLSDPTESK